MPAQQKAAYSAIPETAFSNANPGRKRHASPACVFAVDEATEKLRGAEHSGHRTWNSKYDGRYAPRPAVFQLLHRLQKRKPEMRAFYGQDLHWKKQFRGLLNTLPSAALAREDILTAFRSGDYQAQKGGLLLPSDGRLPETLMARFEKIHRRSDWMRSLMKRSKKVVDGIGMGVPSSLKSHLRRIF